MKEGHNHTPAGERRIRKATLDETIAESFPASDPASRFAVVAYLESTTGLRVGA